MYSTFITKFKTELNTRYSNAIKEIHDIIWNKFIFYRPR